MEETIYETWRQDGGAPIKCIMDVNMNMQHLLIKKMTLTGLSGIQSRILGYIFHCRKKDIKVYQKNIEETFRLRKSSVTSVLQGLEKKGYIERKCEESDARYKRIVLTEEGIEKLEEALKKIKAIDATIKNALTEEEFERFLSYAKKIDHTITQMYKEEKND